MKPQKVFGVILVSSVPAVYSLQQLQPNQQILDNSIEDAGSGRYWPVLPPYQGIDFAANFNKLKEPSNVAFFNIRDTLAFVMTSGLWLLLHSLVWDGPANSTQDVLASLLSPGSRTEQSTSGETNSRISFLNPNFFNEINLVKMWNFLADPNVSARNLFLNMGWGFFTELMWILPTFIGTIAVESRESEDNVDRHGIPEAIAESSPAEIWNRMISPQGVLTVIVINLLVLTGRFVYWTVLTNIPDVPVTLRKRSLQEESLLKGVADEFLDTVKLNVEVIIKSIEKNN